MAGGNTTTLAEPAMAGWLRRLTDRANWLTLVVWMGMACATTGIAYVVVRSLALSPTYLMPFYLPVGVACAYACAARNRIALIAALLGTGAASVGYVLWVSAPASIAVAHVSKGVLVAWAAAGIMWWLAGSSERIRTVRGMLIFLTCVIPGASAAGLALVLCFNYFVYEPQITAERAWRIAADSARADVLGMLIVMPWLMWLLGGGWKERRGWRRLKGPAMIVLVAVASAAVFCRTWDGAGMSLLMAFSLVPLALVSAAWVGSANAAASVTIIALFAAYGTPRGLGPLATLLSDEAQLTLGLQAYVAILAVSALWLGVTSTANRTSQRQLSVSEGRFREFLRLTSEGVWRCELDEPVSVALPAERQVALVLERGYLAECNDAMARMYGAQKASELEGVRLATFMAPGDVRTHEYLLALVKNNYSLVDVTSHERGLDGSERCFSNSLVAIVEGGNIVRAWGTQRDISATYAAQARLEASELRLRTLIDSAPHVAVQGYDREGRIIFWSKGAESLFEISEEKAIGKPISIINLSPEATSQFFAVLARIDETGEVVGPIEWRFQTPSGQERIALGSLFPLRGADGCKHYYCVDCDVSEAVHAEQERQVAEERLYSTQKLESLGVMAGGVAHDFNNLLVGILGNAGLAAAELPADHPASSRLRQVQETAQRAAELTRQLLAYAGKARVTVQAVDVVSLIGGIVSLLPSLTRDGVVPAFEHPDSVALIDADKTQLEQVLLNLLINAAEAGEGVPGAGVAVGAYQVQIDERSDLEGYVPTAPEPGDYVCIKVSDTGRGIAPENIERLFDPFFSTKFTGRGLGLAVVLGIIRGHHGAIRVRSAAMAGTTFTVLLPMRGSGLADVLSQEPPRALSAAPRGLSRGAADGGVWHGEGQRSWRIGTTAAAEIESKGTTHEEGMVAGGQAIDSQNGQHGSVLVVDDEPLVLDVMRRTLEALGWATFGAANAGEAYAAMEAHPLISIAIIDVTMPQVKGSVLAGQLRARWPNVTLLLSSGYSSESIGNLEAMGVDGFVAKPFTPENLLDAMLAALSRSETRAR